MKYTLDNGEEVNLSLSYGRLYRLREKDRKAYDNYQKAYHDMGNADTGDFTLSPLVIIYTAYVCGLEAGAAPMTFVDFLDHVDASQVENVRIVNELIDPKKKTASAGASGTTQGTAAEA